MFMRREAISCTILSVSHKNCDEFDVVQANNNIDMLIHNNVKAYTLCMLDKFSCYCAERLIELTSGMEDLRVNLVLCEEDILTASKIEDFEDEINFKSATSYYQYNYLMRINPDLFDDEDVVKNLSAADGTIPKSGFFDHVHLIILKEQREVVDFCRTNTNLRVHEQGVLYAVSLPCFNFESIVLVDKKNEV